jgi:hypothetical protein
MTELCGLLKVHARDGKVGSDYSPLNQL